MSASSAAELERLQALRELDLLDTEAEPLFDRLTELAALTFDTPISLITLVDSDRQWFKSRHGIDIAETPREIAFCHHAIQSDEVMVVPNATEDARFRENPLVTHQPNIRFYAGAPLRTPAGFGIGTLCVIDDRPRPDFSAEDAAKLRSFAESVTQALLLRKRARESERLAQLADERLHLLTLAEELAGVGAWSWDAAARRAFWSDEVYRIYGQDPTRDAPAFAEVAKHYHPDDIEAVRGALNQALETGAAYRIEARYLHPIRGCRQVVVQGAVRRDSGGLVTGVYGTVQDVTALRLADSVIRASEARARLLAEHTTDLIVRTKPDATIIEVSSAIRNYGYEPEDLVGLNALALAHADDIPAGLAAQANNMSGEPIDRTLSREYRLKRRDGGHVWVEGNPTLIADATGAVVEIISIYRDITERKEMELRLAASEARYRLLAENATDVIACYAPGGVLTYVSPAANTVIGFSPEEMVGANVIDFMHPDDVAPISAQFADYLAAGPGAPSPRYEYRSRHRDGDWVWLEAHPRAIYDAQGQVVEFQDVVRDISERKALETDIAKARDVAVAATEVKSQFLANMSHEIRTPLTAVIGYSNLLLKRTDLAPQAATQIERVSAAGQALLAIVNDVLDFSKLEAGQFKVVPQPCSPAQLMSDALALFAPQAEAKGLNLVLALDPGLPDQVSIDPDRVRQILLNLIGNAVKFTDAGSVRLVARHDPAAGALVVAVEDTGAGLTEAQRDSLFQRFSQVDLSAARRHGGTGLGLAICKGLVEAMGGEIGVHSQPGDGSVFHFSIAAPVVAPAAVQTSDATDAGPPFVGLRVLVVDDNAINRSLARAVLEELGGEVTEAEDGAAAIAAAAVSAVDVILMDLRMPGLNGHDAMKAIRAGAGPNHQTPILAFTADADLGWLGETHGFDGVARKPIDTLALAEAIFTALNAGAEDERMAS
ncbi:PAS domain S-box protein [Phenylobacterium aquaticum]|uniref:PAS domain S-box protein n=1 Tax=Phenylobacterium aquaticum TaxID=1763816 RepID=UPI0026EA6083|nr:PAS domain S-box protein [Phenylobacterium aquaticum]